MCVPLSTPSPALCTCHFTYSDAASLSYAVHISPHDHGWCASKLGAGDVKVWTGSANERRSEDGCRRNRIGGGISLFDLASSKADSLSGRR